MRLRMALLILVVLRTAACQTNVGVHGEVLSTPLTGVVLSVHSRPGHCTNQGCQFEYRLRFNNPMDRDVNVQSCHLVDQSLPLPLTSAPPGLTVAAHATQIGIGIYFLPIKKSAGKGLIGRSIECTGIDWHGNAPS